MTDIVLIVLVLLVVGVGLWWLLGGSKKGAPPAVERRDAPAAEADRAAPPDPEMLGTPMQATFAPPVGSAAAPVDAPPPPGVSAGAAPDDLTVMKGVGPKLAALLASLGVTRYDQIAAWNDADLERVDAQLGNFKGRARRDQWIEQAGYLATGDRAGFEAKFGKIEG